MLILFNVEALFLIICEFAMFISVPPYSEPAEIVTSPDNNSYVPILVCNWSLPKPIFIVALVLSHPIKVDFKP